MIFGRLSDLIHSTRQKDTARFGLSQCGALLAHEAQNPREGSGSIIGHLTGIIFVQAVRTWIESPPDGQGGWFGGLRDKQIQPSHNSAIARLSRALKFLLESLVIWVIQNCFAYGMSLSNRQLSILIHERVTDHAGLAIDCKCQQDQSRHVERQC